MASGTGPSPTHDMEQAKADLDEHGFALIENALSPTETKRIRDLR